MKIFATTARMPSSRAAPAAAFEQARTACAGEICPRLFFQRPVHRPHPQSIGVVPAISITGGAMRFWQ